VSGDGRGHVPAPDPAEPGIFSLSGPGTIQDLVADAGFAHSEL
jgi:hypothetical protein